MRGINASVVGLLDAALYHPVWIGAVTTPPDIALLVDGFLALTFWRLPRAKEGLLTIRNLVDASAASAS